MLISLDGRRVSMLTPGPLIGGERRYWALGKFLLARGWELDAASGDPRWDYPPAFGGVAIALNPEHLDIADLADLGPLRPTVYLGDGDIIVIGHGTWNGCERHRERRWRFPHGDLGGALRVGARIAEVERAAVAADPQSHQRCIVTGLCGAWLRRWHARGGRWPGRRT